MLISPACAGVSAVAFLGVAYQGLLVLASLSRRAAEVDGVFCSGYVMPSLGKGYQFDIAVMTA